MYKIILTATFIASTSYAAIAKEVCRDEQVRQINCTTANGKQSCTLTYVTAQRCHQEPDTPAKSAAAGRADQIMQSDNETNWVPEKGSISKKKQMFFVQ